MRRGVLAILGTVAGTGLLVGAKLGTPAPPDANAAMAGTATDGASPPPADPPSAAAATGGTKAAASKAPAAGLKDGMFVGKAYAAGVYEMLSVTITVENGKLTAAQGDPGQVSGTTQQITNTSLPKLQQEALTAQSAKIATVSGATYTSGAYRMSLQSALDQAKG
jgi:uncharacterized protein with FMN-binding domain